MNLRTTIRRKLLCSLGLCLWLVFTAQSAKAGPILLPGSGYGETAEAFRVVIMHGPVGANAVHIFAPALPGAMFWNFSVVIRETNGAAGMPDSVQAILFGQHIVGVPGHPGEGPNGGFAAFNITITANAPGVNIPVVFPPAIIPHPPIDGHTDQFTVMGTFTVAIDGLNITAFTLELIGRHCFPQCPSTLPPINKSLREVPEWNALMLFGSGLAGLLGYVPRRRKGV